MPFNTELTRRLGLRIPVIAAPLGRGSTPNLLGALAGAGSMGFVALMHMPEPEVQQSLYAYLAAAGGGERFGVNLTLIVDQSRRLDAALDAGCRIVSLWQGNPAPYVRRAKDAGAVVFWTVAGPVEATRAADLGVDFIVCQGREAGGHLVGEAPLMALLPAVVDASRGVPVVAAGGVADGRGLAAVLALGACGAWLGTRFVTSAESGNHPGHKRRITEANFADLAETTLFDGGWPDPDSPHRVLRNITLNTWQAAGCPSPGARPGEGERIGAFPDGREMLRYDVATPWEGMEGDWAAGALYAGASSALIADVEPVATILACLEAEAEAALHQVSASKVG